MTKKLLKEYNIDQEEIDREVEEIIKNEGLGDMDHIYDDSIKSFDAGSIIKGKILDVMKDDVIVDIGYKSEGVIPLEEFDDPSEPDVGDEIEVLLETVEDDSGLIVLSKKKADRIRGWEKLVSEKKEGDVISGVVIRKIKGGLLVDVGVPVFLPASQIDIRRPGEIGDYIGQEVKCIILKIDEPRRNIVISRRKLIEDEREKQKRELLSNIEVGQIRKGVVKNIADFGAFIDLGGIDGLLHVTDMSWGRISHPSEILALHDEIEVKVLNVDKEKEKIALGLKQKTESPWTNIEEKYPVGSKVKGKVVNIVNYGAFVKLEEGVEGLVHISEMSWTRRVNHPSEMVAIGDMVEVVILGINKEKEEVSLGMKQVDVNPWTLVEEKYPVGTHITGRVRNLTNYGAFVEIEEGIDGLLHISDMSWTKKVSHPSEIAKKGEKIETVVLSVDQEKKRVALGLKQLTDDPWEGEIQRKYLVGDIVRGKVTKTTSFGAFVELEKDLEGLLHISELADRNIQRPEEIVKVGDEIDVRIIKIDSDGRKIGLSLRQVDTEYISRPEPPQEQPSPQTDVESHQVVEAREVEEEQPSSEIPSQETADVGSADIQTPVEAESDQKGEEPEITDSPPENLSPPQETDTNPNDVDSSGAIDQTN